MERDNISKSDNSKRKTVKGNADLRTVKDDNGFVRIDPRFLGNI